VPVSEPPLSEPPKPASLPRQKAPAGSTDCHFHIFGPPDRYPLSPGRGYTPSPEAHLNTYLAMANTLGLERMVIVNPTPYGTDHQCTIDTIRIRGVDRAKGVAVINDTFSASAIWELNDKGFCAARVNSVNTNTTPVSQLEWVAKAIAPLGWHLELYVEGKELPGLAERIVSLPVSEVVIDHMGRIPTDRGMNCPEFQTLLRLLASGKCWVKLCGYRSSTQGPPYVDLFAPARKIIETAPERCVWGTDWPHPRRSGDLLPDDGTLLNLLYEWTPSSQDVHRILVDNPSRLYGFAR
jgi:predicted TIM-barrel fold metal-dependent hydrolase